jgi:hypothetical protein
MLRLLSSQVILRCYKTGTDVSHEPDAVFLDYDVFYYYGIPIGQCNILRTKDGICLELCLVFDRRRH